MSRNKFIKDILKVIMQEKPISDVWHYFLGNYRYYFYYGGSLSKKFKLVAWLRKRVLRKHIIEQIAWRIKWMDPICYNNGECKLCGCSTTALQMATKSCDKPCYPTMMNKHKWRELLNGKPLRDTNGTWIMWITPQHNDKPQLFKETIHGFTPINMEKANTVFQRNSENL